MQNNLCTQCDGRGFYWRKHHVIDDNGTVIDNTFRQGNTCRECNGSGVQPKIDGAWWFIALFLASAAITFFGIIPLIRHFL